MKIGFTCGAFDLVHAGHYLMFAEAKQHCDHLIVGLQEDPSIDRALKNKPVMSLEERLIILQGIKYIDSILIYQTEQDLLDWLHANQHRLSVRIIGLDWKDKPFTGHELPIPVIFNARNHSYSSSELRQRIINSCK